MQADYLVLFQSHISLFTVLPNWSPITEPWACIIKRTGRKDEKEELCCSVCSASS